MGTLFPDGEWAPSYLGDLLTDEVCRLTRIPVGYVEGFASWRCATERAQEVMVTVRLDFLPGVPRLTRVCASTRVPEGFPSEYHHGQFFDTDLLARRLASDVCDRLDQLVSDYGSLPGRDPQIADALILALEWLHRADTHGDPCSHCERPMARLAEIQRCLQCTPPTWSGLVTAPTRFPEWPRFLDLDHWAEALRYSLRYASPRDTL
jgi:hypothetical protein